MSGELRVHVGEDFQTIAKRVADAWHRAERGEDVREEHVTFESWDGLARVLSGRRLELLRHLHRHPAASIAALARTLGRDYKRVHEDVSILAGAGLIDQRQDGTLHAEYGEIRAVIAL